MIVLEVMRTGPVLNDFDGRTTGFATRFDVEQRGRRGKPVLSCTVKSAVWRQVQNAEGTPAGPCSSSACEVYPADPSGPCEGREKAKHRASWLRGLAVGHVDQIR